MATYQINGRIKNSEDFHGINGVYVKAVLKYYDGTANKVLGTSGITSTDGIFSIQTIDVNPELVRETDIFFEMYSNENNKLLKRFSNKDISSLIIDKVDIEITDISNDLILSGENYIVKGKLLNADGTVPATSGPYPYIAGLKVYFVNSRGEETDWDASNYIQIDANGEFSIQKTSTIVNPSIIVKVFEEVSSGTFEEKMRSPLIINAKNEEVINLSLGGAFVGKTEFTKTKEDVDSKLGTDLESLKDANFAMINNETKVSGVQLDRYIHAKHFKEKLGLGDEYIEVFYGLLQAGAPKSLRGILASDPEVLSKLLAKSDADNITSVNDDGTKIEAILNQNASYALQDTGSV